MHCKNVEIELMGPHFEKFHLRPPEWPFKKPFVLHHFKEPDVVEPHDHPFDFVSHILEGGYIEERYTECGTMTLIHRKPGEVVHYKATDIHRIIELPEGTCTTISTYGPTYREVKFWSWND